MKQGLDLDPLSLIINVAVGWSLYFARRYDDELNNSGELSNWTQTTPSRTGSSAYCSGRQVPMNWPSSEGEKAVKLSGGSPLIVRLLRTLSERLVGQKKH